MTRRSPFTRPPRPDRIGTNVIESVGTGRFARTPGGQGPWLYDGETSLIESIYRELGGNGHDRTDRESLLRVMAMIKAAQGGVS